MKRILIVDDKEENLSYLQALLTAEGYDVELARHGAEALVNARGNPPDMIISDLLMPVMDGYTLLRHWKRDARLSRAPFVVHTATYVEPEDEQLALSLGADAFIAKPAEPDDLLARLREVEAAGATAVPIVVLPEKPSEEVAVLQSYSETLIRKLEQKTMQLEEANRAMQKDIAARRQAEAALRASEAQFASAFIHAAIGMALLSPAGRYLKANPALCEMLGYSETELLALTYRDVTHPDDRGNYGEMRSLLNGEAESLRMEKRYLHRDGHVIWGGVSVSLLREEAGEPVHFIAQVQDITEQRNAEEAAARALSRLSEAQRIGQMGDWEWSPATESILWSPQVFEIFGRDPRMGPPRNYEEYTNFYDPENRVILKASVAAAIRSGKKQTHELTFLRTDGRRIRLRGVVVPRKDESGHVVTLHGTVQDVTASRQTEEALRRSEALFRTLVQTSWEGFHLIDPTGRITYESPAATRMLGYAPEELVGRNVIEFIHPEDVANDLAGGRAIAPPPGQLRHLTQRVRHKDGGWRWIESSDVSLVDHPDVGAIAVNYRDVTERVESETAMRRMVAIVESSADAIIGKTADGVITSWNKGAEKLFGYTASEMIGGTMGPLLPPDRVDDKRRILGSISRGESIENFETQRLTKSGRLIDVAVTASPISESDGRIVGISTVARDITARKAAEIAATSLLRVLEASLNEIYIFDAETKHFEYANEAALRNLGYSMEDMRGLTPIDLTPEFESEAFHWMTEPLRSHEKPKLVFESMHRRADGSLYPVEAHMQFVERNDRNVFLVVGNDVSERKRAETALRESEAEFRALAEAMPQMVWIMRGDGSVIYHNQQWMDYTGQTFDESLGEGWKAALHPDDRERVRLAWENVIATGALYSMECRIRRADGVYRWWLVRGVPQRDVAGNVSKWFGTCTDIHDLKQADLEIQSLNADLEARVAQRTAELHLATQEARNANRAKSEFLSRTSHELRTPLNAILGFAQLLEAEGRDPEEADNINQILRAGRHLLGLINEMLDISRIEAGQLELERQAVPLNEVVSEALTLIRPMASDRGVTLEPFATSTRVVGDRQRVKQVVLNFLSNAVKYNRPGGRVTCTVADLGAGRLRFSVADTGIGIAAADASKVFTAFARFGAAAAKVEGIGLGLAISRQLIEAMGGHIGFDSVLGEGSTFWVDLPTAENTLASAEAGVKPPQAAAHAISARSRKLLYIEDNTSNLKLVTRIAARRPNVEFLSAANGTLGLEMARSEPPDLILLDLHLPDIQGDEVLRQLHADPATAAIPVIMLSADAVPARREQLLAAGAHAFLTKPLEIRAFLAIMDEYLG